jgi:hypothetical protein
MDGGAEFYRGCQGGELDVATAASHSAELGTLFGVVF